VVVGCAVIPPLTIAAGEVRAVADDLRGRGVVRNAVGVVG